MCKCTPEKKTPFCGKGDCQWPHPEPNLTIRLNYIDDLDEMGYSPPKHGHKCGQCGIDWSEKDIQIAEKEKELSEALNMLGRERDKWGDLEIRLKQTEQENLELQKALSMTVYVPIKEYDGMQKRIEELEREKVILLNQLDVARTNAFENDNSRCEQIAELKKDLSLAVEALQYLDIHNGGHTPTNPDANHDSSKHLKCNQCVIEEALSPLAPEGKEKTNG